MRRLLEITVEKGGRRRWLDSRLLLVVRTDPEPKTISFSIGEHYECGLELKPEDGRYVSVLWEDRKFIIVQSDAKLNNESWDLSKEAEDSGGS